MPLQIAGKEILEHHARLIRELVGSEPDQHMYSLADALAERVLDITPAYKPSGATLNVCRRTLEEFIKEVHARMVVQL